MPHEVKRLVLFDVDGTLVNVYGAGRKALEDAYLEVFDRDDAAAHLDPVWFAGKTDLYIFRQVAINAGIPSWHYERLYADLESVYLEKLRATVAGHPEKRLLPGIEPLLRAMSEVEGVAIGLMTGNLEKGARIKIDPWSLNPYFPTGGFGSDAPERSEIGRVALERFERRLGTTIPPGRVLVVGDTIHDISAARACGFSVLAVATGWTDRDTLAAANPDACLDDLSDTQAVLDAVL